MISFSNLSAPGSTLRVCINSSEDNHFSGLVYSQRLTQPLPFSDLGNLILRLDEVLDRQNFPQAFQRPRTFASTVSTVPAAASPEAGMSADEVARASGLKGTFIICVTSRRNSSWQGWIDWMDGTPHESFSSALEFLRLAEVHFSS